MSELNVSVKLQMAAEQFLAAIDGALSQFKQAMSGMDAAAVSAGSSIDKAFNTLGTRSGAEIRAEIEKLKASFATLKNAGLPLRDVEAASQSLKTKLAELNAELRLDNAGAGAAGVESMGGSFRASLGPMIAFASGLVSIYTAMNAAKAVFTAGSELQSLQAALKYATGDANKAAEALDFVRKAANDLGIDANVAAQGFKGIAAAARGTALEGEGVRNVFLSIATASRVMGLSSDQMNGALLAIQQMLSKGTVSAEEFRGQLGERLPGATRIAAQALGVTEQVFAGMLDTGQIVANDFLPKFADALQNELGGSASEASKTAAAALERLNNAWRELLEGLANSGFLDKAAESIASLTDGVKLAGQHVETLSGVLAHIAQNAAIGFMVKLAASMLEVGSAATKSAGDVDALGKKVSALDGLVAKVKFVLIVEGLSLLLDIGNAHRDAMKAEYEADAMRRKTIDTMREQQTAAYGLSLANQEYAGTAIKSAQEFAALGDTQKQAYLNALEGARQYEASLVRMAALERGQLDLMSESEKKTIDYAAAVKDADAAMEEHGAKVREISAELARYGIESESAAVRELVGVGNISKFDYPSEEAMKANHRETASLVEQIGMGCEPAAWHVDGKGGVGNSRPMISYKRPIVCGFQNGEEVPWSWGSSDEIMYAQTISLSHVSLRGISMISLPRINEKPRMLNQLAIGKDDEKAIKMAGISAYEKIKSKIGGWTAVYTGPDEKGEWSAYVSRDGETMIFPIPGK